MRTEEQDELDAEVAAMQFAGGRAMVQIAADWEREISWVEAAVRRALLRSIPQRVGGLKPSRAQVRTERSEELAAVRESQRELEW